MGETGVRRTRRGSGILDASRCSSTMLSVWRSRMASLKTLCSGCKAGHVIKICSRTLSMIAGFESSARVEKVTRS